MNVILYYRVSTDEQAKGFSLDYQEEVLNRFCEIKGYNVIKSYREDESGKNFEGRPEWHKLQKFAKENKKSVDLVLVHKWDRFARNILEAYVMLDILDGWGIGVNAVEQWLDMSVHESKIMLSIYLSQGEVERLKISARVKDGNYKALSNGCFINKAPYGYTNIKLEEKKQTLEIVEDRAKFVKEAFQRVSTGVESGESVLKDMRKRGFKMSDSNFFRMLRKVVYTGKILVPEYKKIPMKIVDGYHDAITDLITFDKVQKVLDGKRWNGIVPSHKNELFPLRNFLICDCCGENMTASSSQGRTKKYHYYHCHNNHRISLESVHQMFDNLLSEITINKGTKELYSEILKNSIKKYTSERNTRAKSLEAEIKKTTELIENADERLLNKDIGIETYNRMNDKYQTQLRGLKAEQSELKTEKNPIEQYVDGGLALLSNLITIYNKSDYERKRALIGSIFSGKLIVSKTECRTTETNKVIELLTRNNGQLEDIKKGTNSENSGLSPSVLRAGLEPARTLLFTGF